MRRHSASDDCNIVAQITSVMKLSSNGMSMAADEGWRRPCISDVGEAKRLKALDLNLVTKRLVCVSNGNIYIFIPGLNYWAVVCSSEAIVFLNSLMDMDMASVNYLKAITPYVSYIEKCSVDNVSSTMPTSVCIGTTRLRVCVDGLSLRFSRCEELIGTIPAASPQVGSLCFMPVASPQYPTAWARTDTSPMYEFISCLFPHSEDMVTLEWVIGNALVDPSDTSKALVLYGEGGTGKSTLIAAIRTSLAGCSGVIPDRVLVNTSRGVDAEVGSILLSNRVVVAGDVGGIEDSTNLAVIKALTGHDYVSVPPLSARSQCSLVYATNRLDDPMKNKEWSTPAIMRRVVVLHMSADAMSYPQASIPQDHISRLDFVLRCVHTRLSYPHLPVSSMNLILTLMGSASMEYFKYLTEADDSDIELEERATVLAIVAASIGVNVALVPELAKKVSPSCIVSIGSGSYLAGIRPSDLYYVEVNSI